ncbi:TonB-dependent siderophore receptor [Oxalicibacterium flavum]|uniref:TonB-dependent siderophore receptor n=1 Tax=Oxalicibacterium flavum TaxID=179467 RepID=UPI00166AEA99
MSLHTFHSRSPLQLALRQAFFAGAGATLVLLAGQAQAQQSEQDAVLPSVQVVGEQETATGPVAGYRASRSATATKTDTPLAETPQSVTVVTRDQIIDQGATNLQDALNYAAGVRSDAYGLDSRTDSVLVRGSEPSTFIDGLRQTNGYYTSAARPDPYTLERIEVLRGPSAMMYGQGSTAGVLNLVSKRPLDTFQGEVGVQIGNFGRKQLQADVTGPLTEDGQWLYRVVAVARDSDTQVDYVSDDRYLLAPSLTWKPNGTTTLTLQASHQRDRTGSTSQFLPWAGMLTPNVNGQIPASRFIGEPTDRYDTDRTSVGYLLEHRFNDQWTARQNVRYTVNDVDYFSHYANSFSIDPTTGQPGGWTLDPINQRVIGRIAHGSISKTRIATLDQHLQGKLQTGGVKHTLLAGLDYTHYQLDSASGGGGDTIDVFNPVYGNPVPLTLADQPRNKQRQTGVYLQDQMKIGDKWIVVAGLRHDRVTNASAGSDDEKSSATTGRLGLMYLLDNGWSPYVSYSESFTPQAGLDFYGQRYKPVEGEQIEAGVKYMPADGKSQFTAAVWRIKEKNQLTEDPGNPLNQIQAGETENRGVELEWKASLTPSFDALAHYNYIELDDQLSGIPQHQAAVWGKWRFSVGNVEGLSLGAGVRYMSSFRDGTAPRTPSVTLLDMMLAWDNGPWRYALNINNLTDKLYNSTCLSRGDCWYGTRRTAVATATYRF